MTLAETLLTDQKRGKTFTEQECTDIRNIRANYSLIKKAEQNSRSKSVDTVTVLDTVALIGAPSQELL